MCSAALGAVLLRRVSVVRLNPNQTRSDFEQILKTIVRLEEASVNFGTPQWVLKFDRSR